jgi:hypothetical protein
MLRHSGGLSPYSQILDYPGKNLPGTNTLAYLVAVKSFITSTRGISCWLQGSSILKVGEVKFKTFHFSKKNFSLFCFKTRGRIHNTLFSS